MPSHQVEMSIPNAVNVSITDVVFRVKAGRHTVGTMRVSRGGVDFTQRGKRYRLNWGEFADLMKDEGRLVEERPIPAKTSRTY